jgi:23S rRNA-/tRNA-specific pseudouridylate synthase
LGERVYAQKNMPDGVAPRVMLHARDLGFEHPTTAQHCQWSAEPPEDMLHVISVLRGTK